MKNDSFIKKLQKRIPSIHVYAERGKYHAVHEGTLLTWRTSPKWDNEEVIEATGFHTKGVDQDRAHTLITTQEPFGRMARKLLTGFVPHRTSSLQASSFEVKTIRELIEWVMQTRRHWLQRLSQVSMLCWSLLEMTKRTLGHTTIITLVMTLTWCRDERDLQGPLSSRQRKKS